MSILIPERILIILPMGSPLGIDQWNFFSELQEFLAHQQMLFVMDCTILVINYQSFFEFRLRKKWFSIVIWILEIRKLFCVSDHKTLLLGVSWSHDCILPILKVLLFRVYGLEYFSNIFLKSMRIHIEVAERVEIV